MRSARVWTRATRLRGVVVVLVARRAVVRELPAPRRALVLRALVVRAVVRALVERLELRPLAAALVRWAAALVLRLAAAVVRLAAAGARLAALVEARLVPEAEALVRRAGVLRAGVLRAGVLVWPRCWSRCLRPAGSPCLKGY